MASLSISPQIEYVSPRSLSEAIALLDRDSSAQVLAGGHSLLAAIKQNQLKPSALVDLGFIPALDAVEWSESGVTIGAMTSYAQVFEDEKIRQHYPVLARAIASIGDVQIRNWGRMGDVFAYRHLACDLLAVALVLEAVFVTETSAGVQRVSAADFISAGKFGQPVLAIEQSPLVTALEFPYSQGTSAYRSFQHSASGNTLCGVAVVVAVAEETIKNCRIAIAGSAIPAARLSAVEALLTGTMPTDEALSDVARMVTDIVASSVESAGLSTVNTSVSTDYLAHLSGVLTVRSLHDSLKSVLPTPQNE